MREIQQAVVANSDLTFVVSEELTKPRKPYLVYVFARHFFVFALTSQQAKNLRVHPGGMSCTKLGLTLPTPPDAEFPFVVNQLEIDNCRRLDGSAPVTGRLHYEAARVVAEPVGITLEFNLDEGVIRRLYTYPQLPLSKSGVIELKFAPIRGTDDAATRDWNGTTGAFCRFTSIPNPQATPPAQPLSNPYGVLLDVVPTQ